jgi:uncharacterized cupin superfamily protein
MRHEGEEFLYILEGELELHTECYAPLILKAKESVYFDSRMGHAYIARGTEPCRALSMCTVPQGHQGAAQHNSKAVALQDGAGQDAVVPKRSAKAGRRGVSAVKRGIRRSA